MARDSRASVWLASALFFLSGATALAYQVIWFKRFSHVWGSSSLAMAGVVAGFLLGLGVGARWLGGLADRVRSPLRGYGLCELGIGALALAVPLELSLLSGWTAALHRLLQPYPVANAALRLLIAFLVLGPPCALMGATLPLLVRRYASTRDGLGPATGWLYAVNTLGAAFGCYVTGFHLLPTIGLASTHWLAVALNFAIGTLAVVLGGRSGLLAPASMAEEAAPGKVELPRGVGLAGLLVGAGALMLQMVWMRQAALLLGGTTYAFTSVVLVVLVGIGLGSWILRWCLRRGYDGEALFSWVTVFLVVTAVGGQFALPELAYVVADHRDVRADLLWNAVLCVSVSAAFELLPSMAAGMLFPLLVHLTRARPGAEGRAVGRVYAWNTVGTTFGAVLPNLILIPWLGSIATVGAGLALYLVAPLVALPERARRSRRSLAGHVVGWLSLPVLIGLADHHEIRFGIYIYGNENLAPMRESALLFHEEGRVCDVLVTRFDGEVSLRVNGKVDASTYTADQVTQLGTGYLPRFLRPNAQDVLVIGYGSGGTVAASLAFPTTRRVDCLEIEAAVLEASEYFALINRRPETSPLFHPIIDDGRSHVQGSSRRYDLIVTEPSNPWMAGIGNLFTTEFYEAARERLAPGGMLGQWLQTYALSASDYALILRTVLDVFPHAALLALSEGDTMILVSDSPIVPSVYDANLAQEMVNAVPQMRNDLQRYLGGTDVRSLLLKHLVLGEESLREWAARDGSDELNTDFNLRLEFDAPLRLFQADIRPAYMLFRDLLTSARPAFQLDMIRRLQFGPEQLAGIQKAGTIFADRGRVDIARALVDAGLAIAPDDPALLADRFLYDTPSDPEAFARAVQELIRRAPREANRVAVLLGTRGEHARAVQVLEPLIERYPDAVTLWVNLAISLDESGRREEARQAVARALELDPQDSSALDLEQLFDAP